MSKSKKKNNVKPKSLTFKIGIVIIIVAFLALLLSNLFTSKNVTQPSKVSTSSAIEFNKEGELTFQSAEGEYISQLDLEFAEDYNARANGLMYRTEMTENQGMMFIFPNEEIQSFWMKNTILPLDMYFINSSFKIVTIHKNTTPYSQQSYASTEPAQYVLETNAGYAEKYNVKVGDKVIFRRTK